MAFDSVFNGDPTTPNVSASGEAAFGIDLATGQLYYRNPQDQSVAGWQECAGSGGGAPINSPNFTGIPTAPTAAASTDTTQIATTEMVQAAIAAAPPPSGVLSKATGTITSAQILAFGATPVTIVADPGAGKYIQPWFFTMEFIPNTTPYSIGEGQSISLTTVALNGLGGSWANFEGTGLIDQTVKQLGPNNAMAGAPFPLSVVEHVALVVLGTGGSATLGDGTIAWTLYYTTETAV